MLNKKRLTIIVSIIYVGIILMSAWKLFDKAIISEGFYTFDKSNLTTNEWLTLGLSITFLMTFFTIISLFQNHMITTLYLCFLGFILATKSFYKDKVDITDKKNDDYYRNLLKEYSIGELGYINDFKLMRNDLAASLLMLELKKKIIIQEQIKVVDSSYVGLVDNEIYLLDCLNNNRDINIIEYGNIVFNDCVKKDLLVAQTDLKKSVIKKIVGFIIFILILNLMLFLYNRFIAGSQPVLDSVFLIITFLSFLFIVVAPMGYVCYLIGYIIMSKLNPCVRSKKGKELNNKLNGLKNFLKDFSRIHERNREELVIWEDYLVYSVIFDQNNDIRDDILRKINL